MLLEACSGEWLFSATRDRRIYLDLLPDHTIIWLNLSPIYLYIYVEILIKIKNFN